MRRLWATEPAEPGFWHWVAGVVMVAMRLAAAGVLSAGFYRLEGDRGPTINRSA